MKKNNKIKKSVSVLAFLFVCAVSVILSSCSDELDIQQSYPFKVETMPVPKDLVRGQTVEIRCELKAEGKFDGTIYTIRYFQHDGKGSLRMENGTVFQPNDRYLLENEKFRLYYTSASTETQTLTVVVEDNFGKSYEMEFMSLGTVYRNLVFFQQQGQVQSVGVVNGQERFDANTAPHSHFVCTNCGAVIDLHSVKLDSSLTRDVSEQYGLAVERHELTFYGRCQTCMKQEESNQNIQQ